MRLVHSMGSKIDMVTNTEVTYGNKLVTINVFGNVELI
tara:strand:+ start:692 stop:805 length:114 start_codon:yes stop_codon:yes gene_type:complete